MSTAQRPTRERILDAAARLFGHHGYAATGIKTILTESDAPYGSLYHHFPGGKSDLGVAAVHQGGEIYRQLVVDYFDVDRPIAACVQAFFADAADLLAATDFHDACPIATIAMETANSDDAIRRTAAGAFQSWISVLEARLVRDGYPTRQAHDLSVLVFCTLEGAFIHARTTRTTTALQVARNAVLAALEAGTAPHADRRHAPRAP